MKSLITFLAAIFAPFVVVALLGFFAKAYWLAWMYGWGLL